MQLKKLWLKIHRGKLGNVIIMTLNLRDERNSGFFFMNIFLFPLAAIYFSNSIYLIVVLWNFNLFLYCCSCRLKGWPKWKLTIVRRVHSWDSGTQSALWNGQRLAWRAPHHWSSIARTERVRRFIASCWETRLHWPGCTAERLMLACWQGKLRVKIR